MNNWSIEQTVDLAEGLNGVSVWPKALMVVGDDGAHEWRVEVLDDGRPAELSGTVNGYFIRVDGVTIPIVGTLEGNIASVTLDATCYAYEGDLKGIMRVTDGQSVVTLSALLFRVTYGTTDQVVDPGTIIPSLDSLLQQLENMRESSESANTAADRANTSADNADRATAEADAATQAAKESTAAADEATANANAATEAANTATQETKAATEDANAATEAANTATSAANDATAAANSAADRANTEADRASSEADRASAAADNADDSAEAADQATDAANTAANRLSNVELEVESLPPSSPPKASVTQTEDTTTFYLGIPTSDLAFSSFYVDDDMFLIMRSPEGFDDIMFRLNEDAELEVLV